MQGSKKHTQGKQLAALHLLHDTKVTGCRVRERK